MLRIIEKTKVWFAISLTIILIGVGFMLTRGLNFGIDFKGGTKLVVDLGESFDKPALDTIVKKYVPDAVTKTIENTQYEVKAPDLDETKTAELFNEIKETYKLEDKALVSQDQIGAAVGKELTRNAIISLVIACVAMLVYIGIRFQFDYGVAAVLALIHDVLITLTVFAVFNIPINTPFIAAILTVVGYSMNDTIVIFDRVRENVKNNRRANPTEIANKSLTQTIARSLKTSVTTLITITAVTILVPTVRDVSFPLLVGIIAGACSSIFIAPPIWVMLRNRKNKSEKKAKAA